MKRHTILAMFIVAACALMGTRTLLAQGFTVTISADENGHGTLVNSNGFKSALPFALLPDPGPGGLPAALTYGLLNPPGLVAGDLILIERGPGAPISDLIRFNPNQNGGSLVFYSDNLEGADALADTGFPTAFYTNNTTFFEVGPEGANGITYTPVAGQPGFVAGAAGPATYIISSDSPVPEPCSLTLLALGAACGLASCRRRLFGTRCGRLEVHSDQGLDRRNRRCRPEQTRRWVSCRRPWQFQRTPTTQNWLLPALLKLPSNDRF